MVEPLSVAVDGVVELIVRRLMTMELLVKMMLMPQKFA
jgi:hypothetical protein